jgi:hypothetical protein
MRHLIFREGNGICNLCNRDRMDTLYHILNGCPKLTTHYTNRHNKIVQVVVEAISTNCNLYTETIHENKCVVIDEKFTKVENLKPKFVLISGIGLYQIKGKLLQLHSLHYTWLKLKHAGELNTKKITIMNNKYNEKSLFYCS